MKAVCYRSCCLLCSLLLCSIIKVNAQEETNYAIHANIIFRFTRYIDWPDAKKSGDFIVGIVGDTPLYDELKTFIINKSVGSQKLVIRKFPANANVFNCHILFISAESSRSLKKILVITVDTPLLIVSESAGLASKGSCINFAIVDDHLKLEINKNNIQERHLKIASDLLQLGIIVK